MGDLTVHCWWHDEDEPVDDETYIVCGECFHVYQKPGDLHRMWRMSARNHGMPWWRRWTRRTKDIFFCPLCIHDF